MRPQGRGIGDLGDPYQAAHTDLAWTRDKGDRMTRLPKKVLYRLALASAAMLGILAF